MITNDITRLKQAAEVIQGQLDCINQILEQAETTTMPPVIKQSMDQSFTIIVMAVNSLTK